MRVDGIRQSAIVRLACAIWRCLRSPRLLPVLAARWFLRRTWTARAYRAFVLPRIVRRIARKDRINVVFLALNPDMWRYGGVFRRLAADSRFRPVVVAAVRFGQPHEALVAQQKALVEYLRGQGIDAVEGYDAAKRKWRNLEDFAPDIVFYTQPYDGVVADSLNYRRCLAHSLVCYAPYSYQITWAGWNWNLPFHRFAWKLFLAGRAQLEACARVSRTGAANAEAAGYCFEEEYRQSAEDRAAADAAWRGDMRKRVIWAPHHSVVEKDWFKVSSFLDIAALMERLRDEYREKAVFAFKPHPLLKTAMYGIWGRDRTDAYWKRWAESGSSFLAEGDYHALFAGSDAMIHCCGSFTVEYLYTGKPVMYVYGSTRNPPALIAPGEAALVAHYPARCEEDIRRFLDDVVVSGCDPMREKRAATAKEWLRSPNGMDFSGNVHNSIVASLAQTCADPQGRTEMLPV